MWRPAAFNWTVRRRRTATRVWPISSSSRDIAGSTTGALLPTGRVIAVIDGVGATLIYNGVPCVVMRADVLDIAGYQDRAALDADTAPKAWLGMIRLVAGPLIGFVGTAQNPFPR